MTKPRRWRKWLVYALIAVLVMIGVYFGAYFVALLSARNDLHAAIAEVDAAEPDGWQLEDLESRRPVVPEDNNGAKVIQAVAASLPEDWEPPKLFGELAVDRPCLVLAHETAAELPFALEPLNTARQTAWRVADYPSGRFPSLPITGDYMFQNPPHRKMLTNVVEVLFADAMFQAHFGTMDRPWRNGRAMLYAGRYVGGEPDTAALLVRAACQLRSVAAWERMLGQGTVAVDQLAAAKQLLLEELAENLLAPAYRAQRAGLHRFFSEVEAARSSFPASRSTGGERMPTSPLRPSACAAP
jgi:hypothetical protein